MASNGEEGTSRKKQSYDPNGKDGIPTLKHLALVELCKELQGVYTEEEALTLVTTTLLRMRIDVPVESDQSPNTDYYNDMDTDEADGSSSSQKSDNNLEL